MKKVMILGVEVSDINQEQTLKEVRKFLNDTRQHYILTPNPEIVLAASKSAKLRFVFDKASLSLPDGFGLKIGARILGQKLANRVTGADFMLQIAALAAKDNQNIFLLGGKSGVAQKAAIKLRETYPELDIAGAESGGKIIKENNEWLLSDREVIEKINKSQAKILFLAFGCPKQEKWLFHNLAKLNSVKLAMTVGGSLDYLAGAQKRAPSWLREKGLEWLWRLGREPKRIKRIWNATFYFLWKVLIARFRITFVYRHNVVGFIIRHSDRVPPQAGRAEESLVLGLTKYKGSLDSDRQLPVSARDDNTEVLLVQRANEKYEHWQLPQGGVDKDEGESEIAAVLREMKEEVGATNLKILGQHPKKYTYDWSRWHQLRGSYKGQRQTIFYLRFDASHDSIKIDQHEIRDYQWTPIDKVVTKIHPLRRPMVEMAVEGYREKISNFKAQMPNE